MTIADHIRAEEREITMEFATLNFVKNLLKKGYDASLYCRNNRTFPQKSTRHYPKNQILFQLILPSRLQTIYKLPHR